MKTERIMPFALLISAALVSCQKENINSPTEPENLIQKTITIADTPWTSDAETRSFFEEGVGVHLNKLENMSVYYWKHIDDATTAPTEQNPLYTLRDKKNNITGATANTAGIWTFSHPVIEGADKYNYFFVIPHTSTNALNSKETGHSFRLASVQSPEILNKFNGCESSPLSFDPMLDCHIGQAQYGVGIATGMSDIHFKRIFTPLKLTITDSQNVLEGAPVYTVTLKSNAVATQTQTLTGICYFKHSDKFEDAKLSSIDKESVGNGVSTIYQKPIAKYGDFYTTWFIVNPTKLPAGDLTVSVTTATKTITRTVSSQGLEIKDGTINKLTFDISGTEYSVYSVEQSDYYNFNLDDVKNLPTLKGSNFGKTPWTHTQCGLLKDVGNSKYNNALKISKGSVLTYNAIEGKKLSRVRFYGHPRAQTKQNTATIVVKSGDNEIGTISMRYGEFSKNGGYSEIVIPNAYSASNLTFNFKDKEAAISAATLFFNE
ncbi:MAG: hypothetical protein PUH74_00425 [Bacteroidales bacterium]|nr:hypothetical protein [Bacteroidales bacterium]